MWIRRRSRYRTWKQDDRGPDLNGAVQETYPGQFGYRKLGHGEGSRELEFYKQLIRDLAEVDPGLNDEVTESYFDLTQMESD